MYINYELLITALICYGAGSIPFGLFISIIFKKGDPRQLGSKNIGATNVLRLGGWRLGLFTLILDLLKAFIPIKLVIMYNYQYVGISILFVIIGHLYPIWLGFKGGKGSFRIFIQIFFPICSYINLSKFDYYYKIRSKLLLLYFN